VKLCQAADRGAVGQAGASWPALTLDRGRR